MSVDGDVLEWIRLDHALAYVQLAVATCVIYDHITTSDLELELIWRRPKWSTVQYLFLVTRYFGDMCQIFSTYVIVRHIQLDTVDQCRLLNILQGTVLPITLWTMQGIMMYRISSMYSHSRKIIVLLLSAFAIEFIVLVASNLSSIRSGKPVVAPPGANICPRRKLPLMFVVWIPIALFELLVLGLAVKVGLNYFHSIRREHRAHRRKSLAYVLLRDSIVFPLISVLMCIVNLIVMLKLSYIASQLTMPLSSMLPIVLGCRLILNLRETYYQPFSGEMTLNSVYHMHHESYYYEH